MAAIGEPAPDFEGIDGDGQPVSLSHYRGKKVALCFYPKDDTPGCTLEACNLRDHTEALDTKGVLVLGVSRDPPASHKAFAEKYDLPFRLVADPDGAIGAKYGVAGGPLHTRATFLIDESGRIAAAIGTVNVHDHAAQILRGFGLA